MNELELDERIRRKLREQKTELPNELEEKLMNMVHTAQKKRVFTTPVFIAAACLLAAAGVLAAILLQHAKTPGIQLHTGGYTGANVSELTKNYKEYKTVPNAAQALGIEITEPTVTAGGASLGKVIVYFAGKELNSIALEYYTGDVKAYQVSQTYISDEDAKAYLSQFAAQEKVQVNGQDVYLANYDGAYSADMVRGTLYYNISSLERPLGRQDVLDIIGSMIHN